LRKPSITLKHKGDTHDFTRERNHAFMQLFHQLAAQQSVLCLDTLFRQLVLMPTPRFWVSEERAAIVVARIFRGESLRNMLPLKREMYLEIARRTRALIADSPQLSLTEAVATVVHHPAPRHYITPSSARILYYRIKAHYYAERHQRLRHLF